MYDATQNILALGCSIDDLLPDVLRDFMPEHPEIGIRQFSGSPAELAERMGLYELDLIMTARPVGGEGYVFETLGRCDFVILCGQNHWLAQRDSISIRELAGGKADLRPFQNGCGNTQSTVPVLRFYTEYCL